MDFKKSKAKNKKYSVITPKGNLINFGDKRYTQYKDNVLGLYKNQNNNDEERRKSYKTIFFGEFLKENNFLFIY